MHFSQTIWYLFAVPLLLAGCAVTPKNLDNQHQDDGQSFVRVVKHASHYQQALLDFNYSTNDQRNTNNGERDFTTQQIFVRGDVLNVRIVGLEEFDGLYQITKQGTIELPFAKAIRAEGLTRAALIVEVKRQLVKLKWFYKDHVNLDLSAVRLAPINVSVTGAVFNAGRVSVNNQPAIKPQDPILQSAGVFAADRDLVAAIQAAGGIRPDADLNHVYLKRGSLITRIPIADIINATSFSGTPSLINGDQIMVASSNSENARLIRPSQITPPGMRVLLSNLTAPAFNNAQSAVGADATRLPYGASLLDSAVSANCIGGTQSANASRSVVLITRNYGSTQQLVIKRSISQLLANSSNSRVNPYLMPNDGVACYDSRFTNFRDVARGIGELVGPFILGGLL